MTKAWGVRQEVVRIMEYLITFAGCFLGTFVGTYIYNRFLRKSHHD